MAKKQSENAPDADKSAAPAPTAEGAPVAAPKEKKPRAPKKDKASPEAPAVAAYAPAADAPPAAASPDAPMPAPLAPVSQEDQAKKKSKRSGVPPRRGKKLRNQIKNQQQRIGKEGAASLKAAITLLKQMKRAKFDETVEVHMSLGVDTTQSDQLVRGTVSLPHGIGKSVRVVVFCQGDNVAKAKEGGADFAGSDDLIEKIQKQNWLEFDVALATQDLMGKVSRLGKVLGPRGLMPTPKAGTVISPTADMIAAVREFKAGKVEYRTDKGGNVHAGVGKMSFDEGKLEENIHVFVEQVKSAKPTGVKGNYIKSITVSATMSPGVRVSM
ncbi:MAG TPA: 50S ribosomal protein L1 [Gemmataceae bacterium]|nr:50S ribosomal protein L1 [Gemmataceae bacterium]